MICVTGMSVLTPLGDDPQQLHQAMMQGESAISYWHDAEKRRGQSQIGGDLSHFDIDAGIKGVSASLPDAAARRLRRITMKAPREIKYSLLLAIRAFQDAGLNIGDADHRTGVIVAGNNLGSQQRADAYRQFGDDADWMEPFFSIFSLDTVHAAIVTDILNLRGASSTLGAACASGLFAMRSAMQELTSGQLDRVLVLAPAFEMPPPELEALTLIDAIATEAYQDNPAAASRPFALDRQGFVPAEGGACLILERRDEAVKGDIVLRSVAAGMDGNYEPVPNQNGQIAVMTRALEMAGCDVGDIGLISAHATSTPVGDKVEMAAIRSVFGAHRPPLAAAKAMLGHCMWAAAAVETVVALTHLQTGQVPPQINAAPTDPDCVWEENRDENRPVTSNLMLKNSFGFGGYNSAAIFELVTG